MKIYRVCVLALRVATALLVGLGAGATSGANDLGDRNGLSAHVPAGVERVQPYVPRFGRVRPLVAVVGENSGTELTDFIIPYAVLSRSAPADVVTVALTIPCAHSAASRCFRIVWLHSLEDLIACSLRLRECGRWRF